MASAGQPIANVDTSVENLQIVLRHRAGKTRGPNESLRCPLNLWASEMSLEDTGPTLEQFRGYLAVLAWSLWDSKLRTRLDPEDLVQETLLEAQKTLVTFRGTTHAQMGAWLRSILARNMANALRDHGRRKRDVEMERSLEASLEDSSSRLSAWLADDVATPSAQAVKLEQARLLADALARLPADQRWAVTLRHLQDLSLAEIARAMGRTKEAVAGLLRRGLDALRKALGGESS
jgi:RNA polymerase sigma-70 factor, ECF subfamily